MFDKTRVTFKKVSDKQIEQYANSGEPIGKAGAYAFQGAGGALLVSEVQGERVKRGWLAFGEIDFRAREIWGNEKAS